MMKLAFTTLACPAWDFATLAAKAKEFGYDGVEVPGSPAASAASAASVPLSDPAKVRRIFDSAGVRIACLSSATAYAGRAERDRQSAADLAACIDAAGDLGCPLVKTFDAPAPAERRRPNPAALAEWIKPLADRAAARGVTLVIANALPFRTAGELWTVTETANHPAVAVCWDAHSAALASEPPALSVPLLNSRIRYVRVKDAHLGASLGPAPLGEGDVPLPDLFRRLKGIGYTGWVTLDADPTLPPDDALPQAATKLRAWTTPPPPAAKRSDAAPAPKAPGAKAPVAKGTPSAPAAQPKQG